MLQLNVNMDVRLYDPIDEENLRSLALLTFLAKKSQAKYLIPWQQVRDSHRQFEFSWIREQVVSWSQAGAPCDIHQEGIVLTRPWRIHDVSRLDNAIKVYGGYLGYFPFCDSTQNKAMTYLKTCQGPCLMVSEYQTSGRGRRGNLWESSFAENNLFSVGVCHALQPIPGAFPVLVGLRLVEALCGLYPQLPFMLKWPNDIMVGDCKIGGVLVEIEATAKNQYVVVGVGINMSCISQDSTKGSYSSGFIESLLGYEVDKTTVLLSCLSPLLSCLQSASQALTSSESNPQVYQKYDALQGKVVGFYKNDAFCIGRAMGIQADGALKVCLQNGEVDFLHSGEVHTIRLRDQDSSNQNGWFFEEGSHD